MTNARIACNGNEWNMNGKCTEFYQAKRLQRGGLKKRKQQEPVNNSMETANEMKKL